ncbi:MAG: molecular chaperone HtpG [Eubacteriaceae bacterium]|nr:molecular chaperone HtpG [Eubacteriaceae bacterium]
MNEFKKEFKAEPKRLLELMINSIYTNKEIFLREIISNASDAIDKLYYKCLTEGISGCNRSDFFIRVKPDKAARTLTISDNGIGMTKEELEENLGVIAKSGSLDFKKDMENKEDIDIIGQFGVGFYSSFMVAKNVKVISRAYGQEEAYIWESEGTEGYSITQGEKQGVGTDIILTLRDNSDEAQYDEYLEEYTLRRLITHYSDYIRYPIIMNTEHHRPIEDIKHDHDETDHDEEPKYETYYEDETINSMVPLWKKPKKDITEEEYNQFYMDKFHDWQAPLKVIHSNIEGTLQYNSLMFIPAEASYDYYTKDYEKGLSLYSGGVLIMEKCPDLLADYFSFVKGLVDTADLSLNISREMLQHDRQLKAIATQIEKKIKSELMDMLKKDRENYEKFFKGFGRQLKYGLYSDYGLHKDLLADLILFTSSFEGKPVSFDEYISRMPSEQKYIYYACGQSESRIAAMPQTEALKEKGFEILYCTQDVDEFALKTIMNYNGKEFRNVAEGDLGIEATEEEKEKNEKAASENKDLLEAIKSALSGKLSDVRISARLKNHAVCFSSEGGISIEMEKVLNTMPNSPGVSAQKVLELNPNHPVFAALSEDYKQNGEGGKLGNYAKLLYNQALLIEGLPVEDPAEFSDLICKLMV